MYALLNIMGERCAYLPGFAYSRTNDDYGRSFSHSHNYIYEVGADGYLQKIIESDSSYYEIAYE